MDADRRPLSPSAVLLSLILPAYNESEGIAQAIAEADEALARLGYDYEIVVVDDGSRDDTAAVAQRAVAHRPRVRLVNHRENRGYGAALRTGFLAARGRLVAFTDADCQFDLADLAKLVALSQDAPIVTGIRQQRQDPWQRRFFSLGYNVLARTLLGTRVRDIDCALKVFRGEVLAQLLPESRGFFVNTEMFTRANQLGLAVAEIGVRHRPRLRGRSKVSLLDIPRTLRTLLPFWWTQVLFAGEPVIKGQPRDSVGDSPERAATAYSAWSSVVPFLLLVIVTSLLFFTRLSCPLLEPEESRYAEIPRQMLTQGALTAPILNGRPDFQEPPLVYWLIMASYQCFGVHDWAARLVPSMAAVLLVLLVYLWGRRPLGERAAFLGALVLCLSGHYVYLGRILSQETLLALWVTAALLAGYRALHEGNLRWRWWIASALMCGLGLLTKGLVALALPAVPLVLYQLLDRRAARPNVHAWGCYFVLALSSALLWYGLQTLCDPSALTYFIGLSHVQSVDPIEPAMPVWFTLAPLLLGILPWSLLLVPLVAFLAHKSGARQRPPALGFFLLAFLWCIAFVCCAGVQRTVDILPAFPPLALVLGSYLAQAYSWRTFCWRGVSIALPASHQPLARVLAFCVLVAALACCLAAVEIRLWQPAAGLLAASVLVGVLAVGLSSGWRWPAPACWCGCLALVFVLLWAGVYQLLPAYHRHFALRGQVRPCLEMCRAQKLPVLCYPHGWDSVGFYLRRDEVHIYNEKELAKMMTDLAAEPRGLVFVKADHAGRFKEALPRTLEFVPQPHQRGHVIAGVVRPRLTLHDWLLVSR
jgi:dolichol-phosphate mannosyltransferase